MANYTLPSNSGFNFTEGPQALFVYVQSQVPIFVPGILAGFFLIVWLSGLLLESNRIGRDSPAKWFAIAGYLTTIFALMLSLISGLINLTTLGMVFAIALGGSIWYFFTRE